MRWINRTQCSFSEIFFSVFIWGYFLFHRSPLGASKYHFANSTKQTYRNASWEENCNAVRWINRTQSSFSKESFQFWTEDISFFTIGLSRLRNITLQIPQHSYRQASWGKSCNSVRWINRTQSSLSEIFFPVFNGIYLLFHHNRLWASKYHFANSTRTVIAKGFLRGKLWLCEMN